MGCLLREGTSHPAKANATLVYFCIYVSKITLLNVERALLHLDTLHRTLCKIGIYSDPIPPPPFTEYDGR